MLAHWKGGGATEVVGVNFVKLYLSVVGVRPEPVSSVSETYHTQGRGARPTNQVARLLLKNPLLVTALPSVFIWFGQLKQPGGQKVK